MRITILPIKFGLNGNITSVEVREEKIVFSGTRKFTILSFDDRNNLVQETSYHISDEDYYSKGEDKTERINALLNSWGIVRTD